MRQAAIGRVMVTDKQGVAVTRSCRPSRWRRLIYPRVCELWLIRVRRHVVKVHVAVSLLVGVYRHRHTAVICDGVVVQEMLLL